MAADCGAVRDRCAATVGHVHASNSGPPFQAFDEYWARWQGSSQSYLDAIPQFCSEMADALERYLEAVEDAIHKLEELAGIALTAIGVGLALTVFTARLSDAAAGRATGALGSARRVG